MHPSVRLSVATPPIVMREWLRRTPEGAWRSRARCVSARACSRSRAPRRQPRPPLPPPAGLRCRPKDLGGSGLGPAGWHGAPAAWQRAAPRSRCWSARPLRVPDAACHARRRIRGRPYPRHFGRGSAFYITPPRACAKRLEMKLSTAGRERGAKDQDPGRDRPPAPKKVHFDKAKPSGDRDQPDGAAGS